MRKVPKEHEGPIDNLLLDGCEVIAPYAHEIGMVPNDITLLSLIVSFVSTIALKNRNVPVFACLYMFSYFLDCLDGFTARKYDQCTITGDILDHTTDLVSNLYLLGVIYTVYKPRPLIFGSIVAITFILMYASLGCSQKLLPRRGEFLDITRGTCPNGYERILRAFSPGTFHVVIILLVCYLNGNK